jgi:hypothetical protein
MSEAHWTRDDLKKLKELYAKAVKDGVEIFKFQGNDLLVTYAKYLIEHLDSTFKGRR